MTRSLKDALEQQKQQTEQNVQQIAGLLGIPLNGQRRVEVAGRNSYVYVRLRSNQNEVIQAYNNQVASAYNLPVLVERQGNRYAVIGLDTQRYENNWASQSAFLPRHGNVHSFDTESGGGGDIVWVYPRQITPVLVMPSGSSGAGNVIVNPYTLKKNDNTWSYVGNTGTASITQHNPTSPTGAIMALVYLDEQSGNPYLLVGSGTVFSNSITGSSEVYPYIPQITNPATQIPLAAIRLITGSDQLSWDNIYDVRQFIHPIPTGSGGGGLSSVPVYNSGTFVGNASQLDFQYPLYAGFSGTTAYPSLNGSLIAIEDLTNQLISGSAVTHFTITGTISYGTDRLYYNGLRQQRTTHYTVDGNGNGITTLFTGTYGDVLIVEYGNMGAQPSLAVDTFTPIGVKVSRSTNQVANNVTSLVVSFNTEEWDDDDMWSASDPTAITCSTPGRYRFSAEAGFYPNAVGIRYWRLIKNGLTEIGGANMLAHTGSISANVSQVSGECEMDVGDQIKLFANQNSGGNLEIIAPQIWLTAERIK